MNPMGYHITNLVLHIADSLLLWLVLRLAFYSRRIFGGAIVRRPSGECRIGRLDLGAVQKRFVAFLFPAFGCLVLQSGAGC